MAIVPIDDHHSPIANPSSSICICNLNSDALFPASFVDDLKSHVDIVQIVQERVPLRKSGATWKGLCPFHGEKTPSFHVNGDKGFFHCFGCGVGGDVIKFVELNDKVSFPEAVRQLAGRAGTDGAGRGGLEAGRANRRASARRLLKAHEVAAAWFREQLAAPVGAPARRLLTDRGMTDETIALLGMGFAPAAGGLRARLLKEGFTEPLLLKSGLLVQRDEGPARDRFRNRLMIPICRDNGAIIAFGGRAMDAGQQPKYLNSPETAIYVKGRTLYGLQPRKARHQPAEVCRAGRGLLRLGAGLPGGHHQRRRLLGHRADARRRVSCCAGSPGKVVLSFDPDAAGQGAAARSSEMLVTEGFQVNVAMLPAGDDPDNYIRRHGAPAYQEQLRNSRQYLEYLLDRSAADEDLSTDEGRRSFLGKMLDGGGAHSGCRPA